MSELECEYCTKRFHKLQEGFRDLPRPNEVMLTPAKSLYPLWEEARIYRERYQAALIEEIDRHDRKLGDERMTALPPARRELK